MRTTGERGWRNLQSGAAWRRHARYPVSLWLVESAESGSYYHHVQDLSVSGFFIRKAIPLPVGTRIAFVLELPGRRRIHAKGRVVHAVVSSERCGNGVEMGVLAPEDRAAIQEFLGSGDAWFN